MERSSIIRQNRTVRRSEQPSELFGHKEYSFLIFHANEAKPHKNDTHGVTCMKKSTLIKGLAVFFAAALLLTYLAFQLDRAATPRVHTGGLSAGQLEYTGSFTATLTYDREVAYTAPAELLVTDVLSRSGESLDKGVTLLRMDADSVLAALEAAEAAAASLKSDYDALPEGDAGRASAAWALTQAEEKVSKLQNIHEQNDSLRMDCAGDLVALPADEPGFYAEGATLARWTDNTSGATLTWQTADGFFLPGDTAIAALGGREYELEITSRRYLPEQRVFEYQTTVPAGEKLSLAAYEQVSVRTSRFTGQYRARVPAYALTWKNSSSAVLYTVVESSQTRELTIQQVDVGVQATDGTWAVIDKSISDPIVFYANRPLKNGDKVIVEESGESND